MTFDELKALDHAHTLQTYGPLRRGRECTRQGHPLGPGRPGHTSTSPRASGVLGELQERSGPGPCEPRPSLGHISNLFYSQPYARLAGRPLRRSGMAAAFFGNSGAGGQRGATQAGPQIQPRQVRRRPRHHLTLRSSPFTAAPSPPLPPPARTCSTNTSSPSHTPPAPIWPTWRRAGGGTW